MGIFLWLFLFFAALAIGGGGGLILALILLIWGALWGLVFILKTFGGSYDDRY